MSFSVTGVSFLVLTVFIIAAAGYALGRITIKGVNLGTAGVFIVALLFGALVPDALETMKVTAPSNALKIIENMGLVLFVAAVGFIAGPSFFKNFKKNYKSYVLLGVLIILAGGLSAVGCIYIARAVAGADCDTKEITSKIVGLLSGSLTSTPAFSAAKATAVERYGIDYERYVTVGHGVAYLFGVIGVVLFVQLIPKLAKADMAAEREKITAIDTGDREDSGKKRIEMDPFGLAAFALAVVIGILVGAVKFFGVFNLTTTGGVLIVALLFGHFNHIGPVSIMPKESTLKVFRELGLMLVLIGAGVAGGINFVDCFNPLDFLYGAIMTIIPMIIGYLFAKYVLKLPLLNNLGSITGGMTSTPALGTLINVAGTESVASAYAATYPFALISVVLVSEFLIILF